MSIFTPSLRRLSRTCESWSSRGGVLRCACHCGTHHEGNHDKTGGNDSNKTHTWALSRVIQNKTHSRAFTGSQTHTWGAITSTEHTYGRSRHPVTHAHTIGRFQEPITTQYTIEGSRAPITNTAHTQTFTSASHQHSTFGGSQDTITPAQLTRRRVLTHRKCVSTNCYSRDAMND